MADQPTATAEEGKEPAPAGPSKLPLLIAAVNSLAILIGIGTIVYTKILFKRPPITESQERQKLLEGHQGERERSIENRGSVEVKPFTANLKATGEGTLHLHYASIAMVLEIRNAAEASEFDEVQPIFMDHFLMFLSKKSHEELTTVQGRYLVRNEVMNSINNLLKKPYVTNVFFNQFIVH